MLVQYSTVPLQMKPKAAESVIMYVSDTRLSFNALFASVGDGFSLRLLRAAGLMVSYSSSMSHLPMMYFIPAVQQTVERPSRVLRDIVLGTALQHRLLHTAYISKLNRVLTALYSLYFYCERCVDYSIVERNRTARFHPQRCLENHVSACTSVLHHKVLTVYSTALQSTSVLRRVQVRQGNVQSCKSVGYIFEVSRDKLPSPLPRGPTCWQMTCDQAFPNYLACSSTARPSASTYTIPTRSWPHHPLNKSSIS